MIKSAIRTIVDYPKPGIHFRDITTLVANPEAFSEVMRQLTERYIDNNIRWVAGIEARGFIFGAALANNIGAGFLPIRKAGKLPAETIRESYSLEYGEDELEIHTNTINKGDTVLIVDDLIATGGTAEAAIKLVRRAGGHILECCFVINLPDLGGAERVSELDCGCFSLCEFEGG
ncbi:MAG: adenine phosphoribosyltransferase [Alteromonadaceae bacterium]|nr:MAG: adenine phosphoribosyltransferase [Alteromonadaceae bacterium]